MAGPCRALSAGLSSVVSNLRARGATEQRYELGSDIIRSFSLLGDSSGKEMSQLPHFPYYENLSLLSNLNATGRIGQEVRRSGTEAAKKTVRSWDMLVA